MILELLKNLIICTRQLRSAKYYILMPIWLLSPLLTSPPLLRPHIPQIVGLTNKYFNTNYKLLYLKNDFYHVLYTLDALICYNFIKLKIPNVSLDRACGLTENILFSSKPITFNHIWTANRYIYIFSHLYKLFRCPGQFDLWKLRRDNLLPGQFGPRKIRSLKTVSRQFSFGKFLLELFGLG